LACPRIILRNGYSRFGLLSKDAAKRNEVLFINADHEYKEGKTKTNSVRKILLKINYVYRKKGLWRVIQNQFQSERRDTISTSATSCQTTVRLPNHKMCSTFVKFNGKELPLSRLLGLIISMWPWNYSKIKRLLQICRRNQSKGISKILY
jgi:hypothetical protein